MRTKNFLAILFLLIFWGCFKGSERSSGKVQSQPVKDVGVKTVQPEPVEDFFEVVGTVRSRKTATLSSKIVGTVTGVLVKEGDKVKKGQILLEIDSRDVRADLQGAEAALEETGAAIKAADAAVTAAKGQREFAAATFHRYESLVNRGSVTPQEYDEASAKYKVANAEVDRAEGNLRALKSKKEQAKAKIDYSRTLLTYTKIAAPFDGLVTAKIAELGIVASPGTPLLTVEETVRYRLETQVGESWLVYIHVGDAVPVSIDSLGGELSGTVAEMAPAADPQSRTFTVKIELPPQPNIHSGLYGKARISSTKRNALLVPVEAVLQRGQLVGLYVADREGLVQLRLITTGKRYNQKVEILSGLISGERVVIRGAEKVSEGSRISAP